MGIKAEIVYFLKREFLLLLAFFAASILALSIIFYKESFYVVFRLAVALWWLFVIPGCSLMFYYKDKLDLLERVIFGAALGIAVYVVFSYPLGLIGINVKYHIAIIPLSEVIISFALLSIRKYGSAKKIELI